MSNWNLPDGCTDRMVDEAPSATKKVAAALYTVQIGAALRSNTRQLKFNALIRG